MYSKNEFCSLLSNFTEVLSTYLSHRKVNTNRRKKWFHNTLMRLFVVPSFVREISCINADWDMKGDLRFLLSHALSNFLVSCHILRPIHNPLRSLMKTQQLGRNISKSTKYGVMSPWINLLINFNLIQQDDGEH